MRLTWMFWAQLAGSESATVRAWPQTPALATTMSTPPWTCTACWNKACIAAYEPTSATHALAVPSLAATNVADSSISLRLRALHTTAAPARA